MEHFTTSQEIDKEVVDSSFHAEEVGNKYFEAFLPEMSEEDKKPFFWPFFRASLITDNEMKKAFLKPLLLVKEFAKLLVYLLIK